MNAKKIVSIVLCAVMGLTTAVFVVLSVMNIVSDKDVIENKQAAVENKAAGYVMSSEISADSKETALDAVVSNNYKGTTFPEGMLDELKAAYAVNNNLVGWLTIPGTEIDTAVLQSETSDKDRYLKYDFYEDYTYETTNENYGNLYLHHTCSNSADISRNMVIHGHTTGKSSGIPKQAFRSLYDYRDMQYFIEHPIIKYSTLYGEHTYKICAVFMSSTQRKDDNGYMFNYIYPNMSETNMVGYIDQVQQRMLYETGVSLEPTDKIITLSTCIYDFGGDIDTRLVVVGRLLHEGESESIDTSLVKDNPDYRRPQAWYNKKGMTNPYRNEEAWEPSDK